jgi:hypothetical protein
MAIDEASARIAAPLDAQAASPKSVQLKFVSSPNSAPRKKARPGWITDKLLEARAAKDDAIERAAIYGKHAKCKLFKKNR